MTGSVTTIEVTAAAPYTVRIGPGPWTQVVDLAPGARQVAVIHSQPLEGRASELCQVLTAAGYEAHTIAVPDAEQAKAVEVANFCWTVLGQAGFTRSDVIVGLGGGATTDLAGFVAATWLRGVRLVQVPTSLLAMVDAAVGGKTGVNTAEGKNLVGCFHEPVGVVCDLDALGSLPRAELVSGLAEVVKCGFIADPVILDLIEEDPKAAVTPGSGVLGELVTRSIAVKARVVSADLRETGAGGGVGRELLNYGHTFGHAVELVERYQFRHGAAVAIGMRYVAELAHLAGHLDRDLADRHRHILSLVGLPTTYLPGRWEELLTGMRVDKKSRGGELRFVVLEGLARPAVLTAPDSALLTAAYAEILR